jgi:hypothetical protein
MLVSMSLYCSLQAVVVLTAVELLLPQLSGGQGPVAMWALLARHPGLWANVAINGAYLLSITVLLREAMGAIYVVFAFLCAAVLVGMIGIVFNSADVDASHMAATWGAAVLGGCGAAFVLWPRSASVCRVWTWRGCTQLCCSTHIRPRAAATDQVIPVRPAAPEEHREEDLESVPLSSGFQDSVATVSTIQRNPTECADSGDAATVVARTSSPVSILAALPSLSHGVSPNATLRADAVPSESAEAPRSSEDVPPHVRGEPGQSTMMRAHDNRRQLCCCSARSLTVACAFLVLSLTSAAGVSIAAYFQRVAGLNSFGYTAVDQVLLPLASLPLAFVIDKSLTLRAWVGEPSWSTTQPLPPSFYATITTVVAEVFSVPHSVNSLDVGVSALSFWSRPWPFIATLIPYHGLEFLRSFLLFYLITAFDLDATYLQMTLVRVALCWCGTAVACTLLRTWVGIATSDAEAVLSPASIGATTVGSVLMVCAVWLLRS